MSSTNTPISLEEAERRATEYGIDISLLEESLRLTPRERMERHDAAVEEILALQRKVSETYGSRV